MKRKFNPPPTPKRNIVETLHHQKITDNYRWLENKDDEQVIEWSQAQHNFTLSYIQETCPPIADLCGDIAAFLDRDMIGHTFLRADRQFFYMKKKGVAQHKLYTKLDGINKIIFDPEKIDPSGKSSILDAHFTHDAKQVAIGLQTKGAEIATYYIINTKTSEIIGQPIEGLRGFSWTKDGKGAYITVGTKEMLEKQIPLKVFFHKIGDNRANDRFLGQPNDAKEILAIYDSSYSDVSFWVQGTFYAHNIKMKQSKDINNWIHIYQSEEFRAIPAAIDDNVYILTNHQAPNFKLMVANKNKPEFEHWTTLYAEQETVLKDYLVTNNFLLIHDKKDVLSRLFVYSKDGKKQYKQIALPKIGSIMALSYHRESDTIFVGLSTFTEPYKIYKLDGQTLELELFFEQQIPVDTNNIVAHINFYTSKDGTQVPIFVMHQKDITLDGNNPTLLYGYGGFNAGMSPSFVGLAANFINRGGVYAIACIRGGDEYGEKWHLDGMLHNKQNSFDDFIAAGEYLIAQKYTSTQKLAVRGGSNGGLLIGAVITQRPDLFKAAICAVPLLDMIRFHKFLIARYWIPEYGDPTQKDDFETLLAYSPYHHIREGINVPTTLVIAGENDTRVDPLHAKKFTAALQNNIGQTNPILLYIDYDSGHGSGKSTEQQINASEIQWRFLMRQLGME